MFNISPDAKEYIKRKGGNITLYMQIKNPEGG